MIDTHEIKKRFKWLSKSIDNLVSDYGAKEILQDRINSTLNELFDDKTNCCYCKKIVLDDRINYCVDCGSFYCSSCGEDQNGTCTECLELSLIHI